MLLQAPGLLTGIRLGLNANVVGTNANISSTQSYFGGTSLRNTGSAQSYANITPTTNFAFGTGNFTIEFWYYPTSTSQQGLLGMRPASSNGLYPAFVANYTTGPSANGFCFYYNSTPAINAANVLTQNAWQNITVVRNSGNINAYINGTKVGNTYVNSGNIIAARCILGADDFTTGTTPLNGYIDELRISNVARYTGNFTPSTQPFIDDGNTNLLYHFDQANGSRNLVDDNT